MRLLNREAGKGKWPGLEMGMLQVVPLLKMQSGDTTATRTRIQFAQTWSVPEA